MTLITSKHFDDNFLNSEYLRIATQINSDKGTSLPVGKNYDMNRMSSLVRALVVAVNDEYSADIVPVSSNYDRNMLGEMLNRAATIVSDGGGGGGDVPEWVPENAKIYIEPRIIDGFATGRAWVDGVGEVPVDSLLGTDPNTENAWDVSEYNPALLTTDGYVMGGVTAAFIGSLRSRLLSGCTIVFRTKQVGDINASNAFSFVIVSEDGNDAIESDYNFDLSAKLASWNGRYSPEPTIADVVVISEEAGALNAQAITLTATRAEIAFNGSEAASVVGDVLDIDNPLVAALIYGQDGQALQAITVYDALASTAGLSALSEATP